MGLMDQAIAALRAKHGENWEGLVGLPMPQPGSTRPMTGDVGGPRTAADFQEMARSGVAKPSLGNIAKAAGMGLSVVSGVGPVTAGIQGLGHLAMPDLVDSPLSTLDQHSKIAPDKIATITSDNPTLGRSQLGRAAAAQQAENERKAREARAKAMSDRATRAHRGGSGRGSGNRSGGGSSRGQRGE